MSSLKIVIIFSSIIINAHGFTTTSRQGRRCNRPELVEVAECSRMHYNYTQMPNLLGHESQLTAKMEFHSYGPLLEIPCSTMFSLLLCSVYFPTCDAKSNYLMGPCQSLCRVVRDECTPVLEKLKYKWPDSLDCSKMGDESHGDICIHPPEEYLKRMASNNNEKIRHQQIEQNIDQMEIAIDTVPLGMFSHLDNATMSRLTKWIDNEKTKTIHSTDMENLDGDMKLIYDSFVKCGYRKNVLAYVHMNVTNSCVPLCEANIHFTRNAKKFGQISAYIQSLICIIFCLTTLLSFLHSSKLRPCERPILHIAGCKLIYSLAFVLAYHVGREGVTCGSDYETDESIRLSEGMNNSICALTFLLQYFFNSSSRLWQMFLIVNWLLHMNHKFSMKNSMNNNLQGVSTLDNVPSSCLQFFLCPKRLHISIGNTTLLTSQKISLKQKTIYEDANMLRILAKEHIFAWLLPGIACVIVLITRRVDADELLGICGVGNQHEVPFRYMVLIPNLLVTIISLLMILYGILIMGNRLSRSSMTNACRDASVILFRQLDSLSIRTSLFCSFLIIPTIVICIVDFMQYQNLNYWQFAQNKIIDVDKTSTIILNMLENDKPSSEWFILRNFMEYIIGISCGIWTLMMHHQLIDYFYQKFEKHHANYDGSGIITHSVLTERRANETASTNVSSYAFYEKQSCIVESHSTTGKTPSGHDADSNSGYYYSNEKVLPTQLLQNHQQCQNPFLSAKTIGAPMDM